MKLSSLIHQEEYRSSSTFEDIEIKQVARSIESIGPKTLFVCIRGRRIDTHTLVREAVLAGAVAVIVEIGSGFQRIPGIPILEVASSRAAYANAWSRFVGSPEKKLQIIGITGTNGKTTTAHMLTDMLRKGGYRTGLIGTVRCETASGSGEKPTGAVTMTTPEPEVLYPLLAEMLQNGVTHAVMEVSSHALMQERVRPIRFALAVFTNLSPEHLDYHRTLEEYLAAKARLFRQCDRSVILIDSNGAKEICERAEGAVYTCSLKPGSAASASAEIIGAGSITGTPLRLRVEGEETETLLPIPGEFSVENALCASLAAHLLGISIEQIGKALEELPQIPGRMETLSLEGVDFDVIIDYAHTERALRLLLKTVRACMKSDGRLLLLFGCGGERDRSKRAAMGRCAEELADFTVVTSDNSRREDPKQIVREILVGMPNKSKRRVILNREKAIGYALSIAKSGDVLLLVGKGHETYEAVGGVIRPFDERKIVRRLLEKKETAHTIPEALEGTAP